jgi:hypothetical protein
MFSSTFQTWDDAESGEPDALSRKRNLGAHESFYTGGGGKTLKAPRLKQAGSAREATGLNQSKIDAVMKNVGALGAAGGSMLPGGDDDDGLDNAVHMTNYAAANHSSGDFVPLNPFDGSPTGTQQAPIFGVPLPVGGRSGNSGSQLYHSTHGTQRNRQPTNRLQEGMSGMVPDNRAGISAANDAGPDSGLSLNEISRAQFTDPSKLQEYYNGLFGAGGPAAALGGAAQQQPVAIQHARARPYQPGGAGSGGDPVLEKLNFIIGLLEEEADQRTDSAGTEIVLYLLCGTFVIMVIDTFVKVGKYSR